MSGCKRFEHLIEEYLSGEIGPADLESLLEHSRSCPGCRHMMELHRGMLQITEEVPHPSEDSFQEMRGAVLRRIRRDRREEIARPFWRRLLVFPAARPAYTLIFAVMFLAVGFLLGRLGEERPGFDEDLLVEEVVRQASLERGLDGYWDSPFIYSNVSVHPQDDGTVNLDFDVTRHVSLTTTLASPLTRELLVYAMIDPSAMGSRLRAMEVAKESMDGKLREALVFILLNDPSLPVRLRSLDILAQHASDPVVRDALLASLAQDPSVRIRLLALESLAEQHVDPGIIRRAIGEARDESDRAVLHRAFQLTGGS
jgi:hypothetical protein